MGNVFTESHFWVQIEPVSSITMRHNRDVFFMYFEVISSGCDLVPVFSLGIRFCGPAVNHKFL